MLKSLILMLGVAAILGGCSDNAKKEDMPSPENPVTISVLHYYNGAQKNAFDTLVNEFNQTAGTKKGIFVESHNQGSINQLEESIMDSIDKKPGSREMPDIFASYADTAYTVEKKGFLVDLSQYMTEEELGEYIDSYIEEGRIGPGDELEIFPTAKSTEVFILNKTDWDKFAQATGADIDLLKTKEGLAKTAEAYYEWTDSLTPEIPNDGKAFYGRDAMANLFIIGSMQLGEELFQVENQKVIFNIREDVMRRIWDVYYVPYIKGYYSAYGKFRADDVKIGEIIALTGSTTSASYFPEYVEHEETYPIEALVLPAPEFEGGAKYAVQQGAGMVVTKSTGQREYAAVEFLKWFTDEKRNVKFACSSSYMPVKKAGINKELLDEAMKTMDNASPVVKASLETGYETLKSAVLYTNKSFDGGTAARKVLEYHLSDLAIRDRERVREDLNRGMTLEEACAPYLTDEYFMEWFTGFKRQLEESVQQ